MIKYDEYDGLELTSAELWETLRIQDISDTEVVMRGPTVIVSISLDLNDGVIYGKETLHDILDRGLPVLDMFINDKKVYTR